MTTATIRPAPAGLTKGSALQQAIGRADDQHRAAMARIDNLVQRGTPSRTFEGASSIGELLERGKTDHGIIRRGLDAVIQRSVADQVTGNNAGVNPPAFLLEFFGLMATSRPAVEAFGVRDAGESGMTLEWPVRSSSNQVAAIQEAQKTAIQSVRVDLDKGSVELSTFAAGSDVGLQLARRSSPSYREAYSRELASGIAEATEVAFVAALEAAATAATVPWDLDATGRSLLEALYAASVQVRAATRRPGAFGLVSSDIWSGLGRLEAIVAPGTTGEQERLDAPGWGPLIHCPALSAGTIICSNPAAGGWAETGPYSHTSPDVAALGYDMALWLVGGAAIAIPTGVVKLYGPSASGS